MILPLKITRLPSAGPNTTHTRTGNTALSKCCWSARAANPSVSMQCDLLAPSAGLQDVFGHHTRVLPARFRHTGAATMPAVRTRRGARARHASHGPTLLRRNRRRHTDTLQHSATRCVGGRRRQTPAVRAGAQRAVPTACRSSACHALGGRATSAPGLGSPLATSVPGLGPPRWSCR